MIEVPRELLESVLDHLCTLDDVLKPWSMSPDESRQEQYSRLDGLMKSVQSKIPDYKAERSDQKRY